MNKKDRRITIFLELFFLAAGLFLLINQMWSLSDGSLPSNLFAVNNGDVPVFKVFVQFFVALASIIAAWTLWARAGWDAGWCMFTLGLLFCHSVYSLGSAISARPAGTIPWVIIILVVMQSFPFIIKKTRGYR